ncbi:hypothetical protein M0R45_032183 [Rubus argutus]|uniref:Uncharacterized protein n=1 Tax=Rubus argutus TaxID=59490 RepID=A0AAW1WGX5_RUBAR
MNSTRANFCCRIVDDDDTNDSGTVSTTNTVKSLSKPSSSSAKPKKPQNQALKLLSFVDPTRSPNLEGRCQISIGIDGIDKDRSEYPNLATIEAIAAGEIQAHRAEFYCIAFNE